MGLQPLPEINRIATSVGRTGAGRTPSSIRASDDPPIRRSADPPIRRSAGTARRERHRIRVGFGGTVATDVPATNASWQDDAGGRAHVANPVEGVLGQAIVHGSDRRSWYGGELAQGRHTLRAPFPARIAPVAASVDPSEPGRDRHAHASDVRLVPDGRSQRHDDRRVEFGLGWGNDPTRQLRQSIAASP